MNTNTREGDSEDARLRVLLREGRPTPPLPPGFQSGVWRRLERAEATAEPDSTAWLDRLAAWLLRPRWALAAATAMLFVGAAFGVMEGLDLSIQSAQQRYLYAVSPTTFEP